MKYCTKCGNAIEDEASFCPMCGAFAGERTNANAEKSEAPETAENTAESTAESITQNTAEAPADSAPVSQVTNIPLAKRKKQPSGIAVKLISIFICLILCVVLTATSFLGIVRQAFDPDTIVGAVTSIEVDDIENLTVTDDSGNELPVSQVILDLCDEEMKEKYDLDEEKVIEFIKDTKADVFIGEVIGDYSAYFITGAELRELNAERIVGWIRENEAAIESAIGYEFKETDYKEIEDQLNSNDVIKALSKSEIEKEIPDEFSVIHLSVSVWAYITLVVLCCALAALIVVINKRKIRALFTYVTVCLTIVGIFYLLISGGIFIAMSLLLPEIVNVLLSSFAYVVLMRGAILFGVGFIATIVHKIVFDIRWAKVK